MRKRTPLEKRLRLRGRVWSFWGYDYRGNEYTASTHQTDFDAALKAARRIEGERSVEPADPAATKAKGFTLKEALNLLVEHDKRVRAAPNTVEFHNGRSRHLLRLLTPTLLCASIDLDVLTKYTDKRLAETKDEEELGGNPRHTIQKEHRVLRHALRLAKKLGRYAGDPSVLVVEGFDEALGLRGFYQPGAEWLEKLEWIEALVAATSSNPDKHRVDRRDDILVYVNLGPRRREPLLIKPEHVNLEARTVKIRMPPKKESSRAPRKAGLKTDSSERTLPLNDLMVDLFRRRLKNTQPGQPLFTDWGSGNRDLQANWARARTWLLERAEKTGGKEARAKLDKDSALPETLTFNGLRRTFCSQMRNGGVSPEDCAKLLGHDDTAMVKLVYGQVAMDTLHRAVAKLPAMKLPAAELPRIRPVSRRHRRRLRAEAAASESCPPSEATDRVCDRNSLGKPAQTKVRSAT